MNSNKPTQLLQQELQRNHIFAEDEFPVLNSVEEYEIKIGQLLQRLLKNDQHALMNILYRIDVRESLVKEAFKEESIEATSAVLARRIMERLQQKIELRLKYREP